MEVNNEENFLLFLINSLLMIFCGKGERYINGNYENKRELCSRLIKAIDNKNTTEAKVLIKKGADPNCSNGEPLRLAARMDFLEGVVLLMKLEAKINRSPNLLLWVYPYKGYMVKFLLEHGADPN